MGGGGVINVSSGAGIYTLPMLSIYCASKFALEGFTEALSYELASQNIFVKSIIPHGGVTSTNFGKRFAPVVNPVDLTMAPAYGTFVASTLESYKRMLAAMAISSADVAEVIYTAATDGTHKLRYFAGNDTRGFLKARYESSSDGEYISYMRSFFK